MFATHQKSQRSSLHSLDTLLWKITQPDDHHVLASMLFREKNMRQRIEVKACSQSKRNPRVRKGKRGWLQMLVFYFTPTYVLDKDSLKKLVKNYLFSFFLPHDTYPSKTIICKFPPSFFLRKPSPNILPRQKGPNDFDPEMYTPTMAFHFPLFCLSMSVALPEIWTFVKAPQTRHCNTYKMQTKTIHTNYGMIKLK